MSKSIRISDLAYAALVKRAQAEVRTIQGVVDVWLGITPGVTDDRPARRESRSDGAVKTSVSEDAGERPAPAPTVPRGTISSKPKRLGFQE